MNIFLKFNKIRRLTTDIEDIRKAVQKSQLIELSEDRNSIHRIAPVKEKTNVDECTIYVERLKSDATHEWLSSVFSEFGTVVYVSIPKYRKNNLIKGFAFVEFNKEEEAEKAVNYFESIGCKMPSNTEPEMLCSVTTFEANDEQKHESSAQKRRFEEIDEQCENGEKKSAKKRKFEETDEHSENEDKKSKLDTGDVSESEDPENKKKKKKKEHKKKNFIKDLGFQVLSK